MTAERIKITYATLRADNEDLQAAYEAGLERAKGRLGAFHRNYIAGHERDGDGTFEVRSPIDSEILVGTFAKGTRADVQDAIAAAKRAQPAWFRLGWEGRLEILKKAAELISERQMEYAGLMAIEVGKTRLEALGEVEEAADLIRYYAKTAEDNAFYDHPMDNLGDAAVHTRTILRPHGVFAVISPFNFPMALAVGPTCAAMMAGNTVVFKPASASAMTAIAILEAYRDAGRPRRRVQPRHGSGRHGRRRAPAQPGHRRHRVHRLVRGRVRAVPELLEAVPAPVHRRDGRQEPGDRAPLGGPRGGGRGDHAVRVRVRRPEVLGQQPGLRRAARPRRARAAAGREDREADGGRPAAAARVPRPGHRRSAPSSATSGPSPTRAGTGPCSPAAST